MVKPSGKIFLTDFLSWPVRSPWWNPWEKDKKLPYLCLHYLLVVVSHFKLARSRLLNCIPLFVFVYRFSSKRETSRSLKLFKKDWNLRQLPELAKLMPLLKLFLERWVAELSPSSWSTLKYLKKQRCIKRAAFTLLNILVVSYTPVLMFLPFPLAPVSSVVLVT